MVKEMKIKSWIVCAAIRHKQHIITGARHFDTIMHQQLVMYNAFNNEAHKKWEQGFIDQFGTFYNREDAMQIIKSGRQAFAFDAKRNGGNGKELYSEGLY